MQKSPDDIDRHIGARIRLRRVMLGVSQEKLAEGLGISFQQIQKYEKGFNRVGASRLLHIAAILDIPINFFFEEGPHPLASGNGLHQETPTQILASKECVALARAFLGIEDKKVQQRIISLVRALSTSKTGISDIEELNRADA